ncbi:Ig-like domain-containing domain [Sphingobacterium sp. WM]|uniref:Ig-like domain-containing domain n=1 Tax=Sphingobacterium sp. WM TaxID=3031802 RepID=UPI00240DEC46|nr:Ig-like domain-containing domain [Sphingobacterium sp. WM]WFB63593.1 Ig-like domain-containing domain [Sphingobacterium sp. WM]
MTQVSKKDNNSLNRLKTALFKNLIFLGLATMIALSFVKCANMQKPTGGPKDSIPPKLLGITPPNLSKNFKEKVIEMTFDEYIKTVNPGKEFSISPDLETQPIYKIKKKRFIIELPDSLEENTTYTINFGKGLVDYNEGNPFINYNYVFATGDQLDSLSISGQVKNGYSKDFDLEKDKEVIAILIPTSRDTIFGKRKASYYTTVDSSGNFSFNNLREDTYRVYALKDMNNDKIYNGNDEWIGFLDDSIALTQNVSGIALEYTKGTAPIFRNLEKKIKNNGSLLLTFNRPLEDPDLKIISPNNLDANKLVKYKPTLDTANIYFENLEFDSLKVAVLEKNVPIDTISMRKARNLKVDNSIQPKLNISNKVDRIKHIELSSDYPIASVDKNKVLIMEDSVSRRNFQLQQDSINREMYHIRFNWRPNRNYELVLQEGAILGPFDEKNKEFKSQFTLNETENYGDINLTFTGLNEGTNYIVELIDESKEKLFDRKTLPSNRILSYKQFPGGKYSIRLIEDSNNNGKWDSGDVYTKRQPERIWYLDRTFTIRANWEQNETIEVNFK